MLKILFLIQHLFKIPRLAKLNTPWKKGAGFILTAIFSFAFSVGNAHAIVDPLSLPNNKFGVHILFTTELSDAARLVNSSGGDWGYITIPIQAGDKDLDKWHKFMNEVKERHIIPIIRLASENYYFDTRVWRKPAYDDLLDFANFLNSLNWPVKNRYIVIFNEVNRGDEWQGAPNPKEYANILNYAVDAFKSLSPDFFIISAGLDNAAANVPGKSQNQYDFMVEMNNEVPGIFGKIDGLGSHSYPNPAFSIAPWVITNKSISSFKFEQGLSYELSGKKLPVFITETGWSKDKLPENQIASYFNYAFSWVWNDDNIIAVTPFLLHAGTAPFSQFSILNYGGDYNEISKMLQEIPKTKGKPIESPNTSFEPSRKMEVQAKIFPQKHQYDNAFFAKTKVITTFLKWLLKLSS